MVYSHSNTDSLRQDANYLDITIHKYNRTSDLIKENTAGELNLYTWFYTILPHIKQTLAVCTLTLKEGQQGHLN